MINLARFKETNRSGAIRINNCYQSDYIGFGLLGNFILTTIAYILLLVMIAIYRVDVLLENLNDLNIQPLIAAAVIGYLMVLGVYTVIAYAIAKIKYARAEEGIQRYEKNLEEVSRMYEKEEEEEELSKSIIWRNNKP